MDSKINILFIHMIDINKNEDDIDEFVNIFKNIFYTSAELNINRFYNSFNIIKNNNYKKNNKLLF